MKFLPTIVMVSLSAVLIGGCGSDTSQEAGAVGTLSLHLSTTSPLQIEYRLRDAIFQIRGPEDRDVSSENYLDDPANQPINEVVRSGVYTVTLAAGWRMEHRASGQAFSDIPATLTSANPLNVTVITDEVTPAIFQFEVEEGQISFGPGTVALQVGVDEIGAEWGTAELIGSNISVDQPFQPLYNPVVAIDAQGNAMAVWKSSSNVDLLGSRFTPSGGWETPELIEPAYSFLGNYQVAMDPQGNAMVVWSHITGSWQSIWANRFTPSGGWGNPRTPREQRCQLCSGCRRRSRPPRQCRGRLA